jgi:hypothetical protein
MRDCLSITAALEAKAPSLPNKKLLVSLGLLAKFQFRIIEVSIYGLKSLWLKLEEDNKPKGEEMRHTRGAQGLSRLPILTE